MEKSFRLKNEFIQRFKELYKNKTGQKIDDSEASQHLEKLVNLIRAIYKPESIVSQA